MIDFIITRCRDKMDIHNTRAMRGVNCWTDHQMLKSKVAFRIRQRHHRQETNKPTKLNTAKLSTISHRESFEQEMDSALAQWQVNENLTPYEEWAALQQVVYNTANTCLSKPDRKHQDWFDPNDQELQTHISRRDKAHQRVLQTRSTRSTTAAYKNAYRLVQKQHEGPLQRTEGSVGTQEGTCSPEINRWKTRPSLTARDLWQDGVNTSRRYSTPLATLITKLWTTSRSALPRQASVRFQPWMRWLEQSPA